MQKNILLIDDEELVIKSVSKLLKKEGYEVTVCRSGAEALDKIREAQFDLIVCDIRMPTLNGIDTIKRIREYHRANDRQPPPEILITGYADETATEAAETLQVADYLYKPFDLRNFLSCVKKNMGS